MTQYIDYAKIPMRKNDIGAKTIGEYFEKLLLTLWDEQGDFSGKRPFGNSGWEYDVYASLISSGVIDGKLDEEGYVADVTYSAANDIVCGMIKQIFARDINVPTADVAPKSEVAREIFGEIERLLSMHFCSCLPSGATDHYDYYEGDLADAIAELKKKYTEEKE